MYGLLLRRAAPRLARCLSTPPPKTPLPPTSPTATPPQPPPQPTSSLSLDFAPEEPKGERTGARSSKDSLSSIERRRRVFGRTALATCVLGLVLHAVYLGRAWDPEEEARKEDLPRTRWGRTKYRFAEMFDYLNKPVWSDLLPPLLPPQHQKPLTLVVSIDDLLVTSTWDRQHGWRTAKRPGADYFLAYLSQFYEVVVFTTQYHYTAIPILKKLDPYNFFINYHLFREATRSVNGKIVKDISFLNRDLSKVIMLDTHAEHVSTHPENAIVLPPWKGDPKDRGLIAMIPFLESIGIYKPADVRPILKAYAGKDVPLEYAKREAEAKQRQIEEWKKTKGIAGGGWSLGSLVKSNAFSAPLTYLEQKRKEAQQQYREEQAYIESHKQEFERLQAEAIAKETSGTLWSTLNVFSGKEKGDESPT